MVNVSVLPDLEEVCDFKRKLPSPVINSSTDESLLVADAPALAVLVTLIWIFPPALKNQRAWLALVNVIVCSTTCDPVHLTDDVEVCSAAEVLSAVALGDPARTDAANVFKFAARAALTSIRSPAALAAVDVMVSLV